jgi:hypothetical protein
MLPLMIFLLHRMGLEGLAISRVCLGSVALLVYLPLWRFVTPGAERSPVTAAAPFALQEGSNP